MIVYDTINTSDVYQVTIGTDGHFWARKGWDQALHDATWVDCTTPGVPKFAPQSAALALKADGRFYTLEAVALDGALWSCTYGVAGNVVSDWKAHLGIAALPVVGVGVGSPGPSGPPGASYNDAELRAELQSLKNRVAAVAKALA